jgi:hypothetical protein
MSQTIRDRVASYRARLRREGLRPIQIWVPDARRPGFADECRRQSQLLHEDPHETEWSDRLDQVIDDHDWR